MFKQAITQPVKAKSAIALGITINWLNKSESPHTKSLSPTVPRKMNTNATRMKGFCAFSPNKYVTFTFANKFHPRIVENAKKNNATAMKAAPIVSPNTTPKAF